MNPKKKNIKRELDDQEVDDGRPITIDALAELTNSDVIQEVKNGLSRIEPLKMEELDGEGPDY